MADASLAEAATTLGVSVETIRRRVKRGQLASHHDADGHLWIHLADAARQASVNGQASASQGARQRLPDDRQVWRELVAALEATVTEQRVELEARRREVQELHVLLERAQRLALPAPREPAADTQEAPPGDLPRPWWAALLWWRR
jgi:predicted site-specific integrase-resolvase